MLLKGAILLLLPLMVSAAEGRKVRILVLCTGNSARSQMTQGFLRSFDSRLEVYSAGTKPSPRVNPLAIEAMKEKGIDLSGERPKSVAEFTSQPFDYVFTVCDDADKNCPYFSGKVGRRVHIGFDDPARTTDIAVFRRVRDEIEQKFREYFEKEIRKAL